MSNKDVMDPKIERLSEKWAKDPSSLVFAPLADAYRRSDLVDEAIQVLKKGLERHPNYMSARLILGKCYMEKRMFELARDEFEQVRAFDPDNLVALRLMGDVSLSLGHKDAAIETYRKLLGLQPANAEVQGLLDDLVGKEAVAPEAPLPQEERAEAQPAAQPAEGFADYFGQPQGLAGDETPTAPEEQEGGYRGFSRTFDSQMLLTEEEPVADLHEAAEHPGAKSEGGAVQFSEYLPHGETEQVAGDKIEAEEPSTTVTLARIYEEQGFKEKALETYQQILTANPEASEIRAKVEELLGELHPGATLEEALGEPEMAPSPPSKPAPVGPEVARPEPAEVPFPSKSREETGTEGKGVTVSLDELFREEEKTVPPESQPSVGTGEESSPDESKGQMDLQSFKAWLESQKGG